MAIFWPSSLGQFNWLSATLATGLLGGFTTFSAFAVECVEQWQRGQRRQSMVNTLGSFLAGSLGRFLLGSLSDKTVIKTEILNPFEVRAHRLSLLLITGFCGGMSTFSTLGLEVHDLERTGQHGEAIIAASLSLAIGLPFAWLGLATGTRFGSRNRVQAVL